MNYYSGTVYYTLIDTPEWAVFSYLFNDLLAENQESAEKLASEELKKELGKNKKIIRTFNISYSNIIEKHEKESWDFCFKIRDEFNSLADTYKKQHSIGKNAQLIVNLIFKNAADIKITHYEFLRELLKISKLDIKFDNNIAAEYIIEIGKAIENDLNSCPRCQMYHAGNGYFIESFNEKSKEKEILCLKCIDVLKDFEHPINETLREIERLGNWYDKETGKRKIRELENM